MKKNLTIIPAIFYLFTMSALPALAQAPSLPHAFFGAVTINGQPAPVGSRVEARGAGVSTGLSGNPLTITQPGLYGGESGIQPKLVVQGSIADAAVLTFFVNGAQTLQTAPWRSGQVTRLDLTLAAPAPTPPPAPTAAPPTVAPTAAPTAAPPASGGGGGAGGAGAAMSGTPLPTAPAATPVATPGPSQAVTSAPPGKPLAPPPAPPANASPSDQKPKPPAAAAPAVQAPLSAAPPPRPDAPATPGRASDAAPASPPVLLPPGEPQSPAMSVPAPAPEWVIEPPAVATAGPGKIRPWLIAAIAGGALIVGLLLYLYMPRTL